MSSSGGFVHDLRTVLRGSGFRRLLAVRLTSQGSDGAFQVGLAGLVLFSPERAATPGALAWLLTLAVLPFTVVGPFAGVLLDRWRRRQVLVVANLVRAGLVLGLAGLVLAGGVGAWLYAGALACLSINRFMLAGLGAGLPHVVDRDELVMANAVSPTTGTLAVIGGSALGYGVRVVLGASDRTDACVLALSAAAYVLASGLALRLGRDSLGPDHLAPDHLAAGPTAVPSAGAVPTDGGWRRVPRELAEAIAHLRERRQAGLALLAIGSMRLSYGLATFATVLMARNRFSDPADTDAGLGLLALVLAASGVGFALAAVVTPMITRRTSRQVWIAVCFVGAAVAMLALVVRLSVPVAMGAALLLGLTTQGSKIAVDAILQSDVDDDVRGRVFTFYDLVFNLAFVAAANLGYLLLPTDGYSRPVFSAVAVLCLLTAAWYGRLAVRLRRDGPAPVGTVGSPA